MNEIFDSLHSRFAGVNQPFIRDFWNFRDEHKIGSDNRITGVGVFSSVVRKELISFRAGIIAGALMAVTPMFIYYGKNPVHEIVLLPFALLAFYSYRRFLKTGKKAGGIFLLLALTFAMLIGWPGYYAAGLIFIHGVLLQPKEN